METRASGYTLVNRKRTFRELLGPNHSPSYAVKNRSYEVDTDLRAVAKLFLADLKDSILSDKLFEATQYE